MIYEPLNILPEPLKDLLENWEDLWQASHE